jgi:hypothetical protein
LDKWGTVPETVTVLAALLVRNRRVRRTAEALALKMPLRPLHVQLIAPMVDAELQVAVRLAAGLAALHAVYSK